MKTPTDPQGLPPQAIYPVSHDIATQLLDCVGDTPWLTCNVPVSVVKAAAEALAAQAATLESIHKIIECAGPEAAGDAAKTFLGKQAVAASPATAVDERVAFDTELAKLPVSAQSTIRESMKRGESNSWTFFQSGYRAALQASRQPQAQRPSVLYRPALSVDGNQWCALYGDDLQSGVAGFGDTPAHAMSDFDMQWTKKLEQRS